MSKIKTIAGLAAFTLAALTGGTLVATEADATPLPDTGSATGSASAAVDAQLHNELTVWGVDRPDAVALAKQVCAILRGNPTPAGKAAAREYLADAGVAPGLAEGWTLGTSAKLYCPEMVGVLR